MSNESTHEDWGVVEMMGHRQVAGRMTEVTRFGTTFLQIEIPQPDGTFVVQLIGGSAIYDLHYTTETKARKLAPLSPVLVDKALPDPSAVGPTPHPEDEPEFFHDPFDDEDADQEGDDE